MKIHILPPNNTNTDNTILIISRSIEVNFITLISLNVIWLAICIKQCCRIANQYKSCKRATLLHPLYKDEQFLSQQRQLYNLKTHFVKYILLIICLCVEICEILSICIFDLTIYKAYDQEKRARQAQITSPYPLCHGYFSAVYYFPGLIPIFNSIFFSIFLRFVVLSILTHYLAARYLNHSFKRTLIKYIIWLTVQLFIVALCSTLYTLIVSFLIFPLLAVINWLVLLRDNIILSRVLKSNLRELQYHSSNKALYKEQLEAYRLYRFFQKILFTVLFLLVIIVIVFQIECLINSSCLFQQLYGIKYNNVEQYFSYKLTKIILVSIFSFYTFFNLIPLLCVSLRPFIVALVKRYKSRHYVYRHNYENMQPLLRERR